MIFCFSSFVLYSEVFFYIFSFLFMFKAYAYETKANDYLHIMLDLCTCLVNFHRSGAHERDERFLYSSFAIMQTSYRA